MSNIDTTFDWHHYRSLSNNVIQPRVQLGRLTESLKHLLVSNFKAILSIIGVIVIFPALILVMVHVVLLGHVEEDSLLWDTLDKVEIAMLLASYFFAQYFITCVLINNTDARSFIPVGTSQNILPALLLAILLFLVICFGFLFILIPGLIWMTYWSVAIPALVAENLKPVAAMRRSYQLGHGNFWRVFLLIAVVAIIERGLLSVIDAGANAIISVQHNDARFDLAFTAVLSSLSWLLSLTLPAALYRELLLVKEGEPTA